MESPEVATGPDPQPRAYCVPRTVRRRGCLRTPSARVGAVLRSGQGGDGRRSGASFGARAGAVGATHSTGCRRPSRRGRRHPQHWLPSAVRMPFGRGTRPPVLAPVAAPGTALRGVWKRLIGVTEKASLRGLTAHHLERCETLVAARFPRTWKAW